MRRARARPDLPARRQGACLLARDPADRSAPGTWRPRPARSTRCSTTTRSPTSARSRGHGVRRCPRSGRSSRRPADPQFSTLDPAWFPALEVVLDGRNSLRDLALPAARGVPRRSACRSDPPPARARRAEADRRPAARRPLAFGRANRQRRRHAAATDQGRRVVAGAADAATTRSSSTPASTTTTRWRARSFASSSLAPPDHALGVGGGSHAEQTAAMLAGLEPILVDRRPDAVLVYGDTNSTLAGALAAAKLDMPVAHVEAGLRSFDRRMPEEINRVVADHLSRWLFAPTPTAVDNLRAEGHDRRRGARRRPDAGPRGAGRPRRGRRDALRDVAGLWPTCWAGLELEPGGYLFATVHRAENREPDAMRAWAGAARPRRVAGSAGRPGDPSRARGPRSSGPASRSPDTSASIEPQGYRTSLTLQIHAAAVLTDSGGVQREAAWLGVPCLVLRGTTEWVEAVAGSEGRMVVVGLDADRAVEALATLAPPARGRRARPGTRGRASISGPRAPPRRSSRRSRRPVTRRREGHATTSGRVPPRGDVRLQRRHPGLARPARGGHPRRRWPPRDDHGSARPGRTRHHAPRTRRLRHRPRPDPAQVADLGVPVPPAVAHVRARPAALPPPPAARPGGLGALDRVPGRRRPGRDRVADPPAIHGRLRRAPPDQARFDDRLADPLAVWRARLEQRGRRRGAPRRCLPRPRPDGAARRGRRPATPWWPARVRQPRVVHGFGDAT